MWMWVQFCGPQVILRDRERIKMSKDFQNKYVGFMLISLVAGVLLIGLVGIVVGFIV